MVGQKCFKGRKTSVGGGSKNITNIKNNYSENFRWARLLPRGLHPLGPPLVGGLGQATCCDPTYQKTCKQNRSMLQCYDRRTS